MTTETDVERVMARDDAGFTPAEQAVLRFTDAFYADHRAVPDAVWDQLKRYYAEPEIVELAWTISAYIMLGKLIHAFRVPYGRAGGDPR